MSDGSTIVSQVIRITMLLLGALGLFSAGLVGTLGMRGKLTAEYLGPLVGREAVTTDLDQLHGSMTGRTRVRLPVVHDKAGSGAAEESLLPAFDLPSPFSADETTALMEELEQTRTDLRERVARLEREKKDLELIRIDLNRRWDDLNQREQQIEELVKSLAAERQELDGRSVLVKEAELSNIKDLAGKVEKMPSSDAARLLMEMTPDEVAKILAYIKPREAGKILAAMPTEFSSKVSGRYLGVLKPGDEKN